MVKTRKKVPMNSVRYFPISLHFLSCGSLSVTSKSRSSLRKIFDHERAIERHARIQRDEIGAHTQAFAFVIFAKLPDGFQIIAANTDRIHDQTLAGFRIFKVRKAVEWKVYFRFIQYVKHNHVVAAVTQHP